MQKIKNFYNNFKNEAENSPALMIVIMSFVFITALKDLTIGVFMALLPMLLALGFIIRDIKEYKRKY